MKHTKGRRSICSNCDAHGSSGHDRDVLAAGASFTKIFLSEMLHGVRPREYCPAGYKVRCVVHVRALCLSHSTCIRMHAIIISRQLVLLLLRLLLLMLTTMVTIFESEFEMHVIVLRDCVIEILITRVIR